MVYNKKNLKISIWNINGYTCKVFNKFTDPDFIEKISQNDIFCLQETHCDLENCLNLPDFSRPVHLIRSKTKNGKRYGGLSVYIRNKIRKGVNFLEHSTNDFIWIKLEKSFFGFPDNIFICFIYDPPENSSFTKKLNYDILELVENDIVKYSEKGKIILAGDLNGRISSENDYISLDSDKHIPMFESYVCDSNLVPRKSQDNILNTRGRQILNLCISASLRILNGRTFGDLFGSYTCFQPLGSSVVDYFIASEEILPYFTYFQVNTFLPDLSDHCQISCMLKCNILDQEEVSELFPMPEKYIWDEKSITQFQDAVHSNSVKKLINDFNDKTYNPDMINTAADDLNKIFLTAANASLKQRKTRSFKHRKTKPKQNWQDKELIVLKKELFHKYNLMLRENHNPFIRGSFYKCLKSYRKIRRSKIRKFKQDILDKLDNLQENDPKSYWKLLDELKNKTNNNKEKPENNISPKEWKEYFENLNTIKYQNQELEEMKQKLNSVKKDTVLMNLIIQYILMKFLKQLNH